MKKKYNIRHVSITYWTNVSNAKVIIYDEDKDGNSPEGHEGRRYEKPSNHSMLKMTSVINHIKPYVVMGDDNVTIFFWLKRKGRKK